MSEDAQNNGNSSKDSDDVPPKLSTDLPSIKNIRTLTKREPHLPVDVLLLTVNDCEFLACHKQLENPYRCYFGGLGYVYFADVVESQEEKVRVALMRCREGSTGPGSSIITVKNAAAILRPKAVISVGTCSGLNPDKTKLGDVVVSAKLTTYASKVVTSDQEQSTGMRSYVSRRFLNIIRNCADGWQAPLKNPEDREIKVHCHGEFLSGPELVSAEWRRKELVKLNPQAAALEMEGEGIFTVAFDNQIEWLIVKGIADYAGGAGVTAESWRPCASVMAASLVAHILSDPGVFRTWPHYADALSDDQSSTLENSGMFTSSAQASEGSEDMTAEHHADVSYPNHIMERIRQLYKRHEGRLRPVPWCDDVFHLKDIFTRLKIVNKEKTRGAWTDEITNMTGIFTAHAECKNPRIVLIEGEPGIGKTTYSQKLAYDWATSQDEWNKSFPAIEVLIFLRCHDIEFSIWDAITDQILPKNVDEEDKENFFKYIQENQSKVLLVLDGLDEADPSKLDMYYKLVESKDLPDCYIVITSRHEIGKKVRRYCDTLWEIVGFTKEDAQSFIRKYFEGTKGRLAQQLIERIWSIDSDVSDLRQTLGGLTKNPLSTTLLCILFEDFEGALPSNRTLLYIEIVLCVLRRYEKKNGLVNNGQNLISVYRTELLLLGRLAFEALRNGDSYFDKEESFKSTVLFKFGFLFIQPGGTVKKPCMRCAFLHKSFQDFFSGFYLAFMILDKHIDRASVVNDERYLNELDQVFFFMNGIIASQSGKTVVPLEIKLRGPLALEAYNKALTEGKACVKRVPVMLIGQDHSGKTSLKNSLMGKPFNEDEDSTVGIDIDPSYFKVSCEIWRPGENDQATNDIEATSFEHHAARLVADELKEEKSDKKSMPSENIKFKKDSSLDMSSSSNNNSAKLPVESAPSSETSKDATESIHTSKDPKFDGRERVPETSSDPTQSREEHSPPALTKIPDEVAILIKKLIKEVEKVPNEEEIYSLLWDFGGQSVYYTTHPLFITTKAMYLLVYDLSRNPYAIAKPVVKQGKYRKVLDNHGAKSNLHYLNFWMTSVASLASQDEDPQHVRSGRVQVNTPPVFLVCTHADDSYGETNPNDLANEVLGYLQTKPYKNQLYNDVFVVNNKKSGTESECSEVIRLRENVLAVAKELPQMKELIPIKWLKYEKALQVTAKEGHKWISFEIAKRIASEVCQIDGDKELSTLLNFLHDQRIFIHFDDTTVLNNMVVLDPQWLVDVFKTVITVKPFKQQEKEFEELWCRLESKGILEQTLLEHVWGPLFEQQETSASLIEIMEKFSLLCPLPSSNASCGKQYLVPSMLTSLPPQDVIKLVDSAQIPSIFFKFESKQVPPGLFPRLVLRFFQWGQEKYWSSENPDLYQGFARFYTLADGDCSVILLCHSSTIEVAVHRKNLSVDLAKSLQSKLNNSADGYYDGFEVACALTVRRQLGLMLECMRKEFCWLKNMKYEAFVMCPICCQGRVAKYNCSHSEQGCEQEECLHFRSESELRKHSISCLRLATAQFNVPVKKIAPWVETPGEQITNVERDGRLLTPEEGTLAQGLKRKQEPPSSSGIVKKQRKLATTGKYNKVIVFKEGSPSRDELEKMSKRLGTSWKSLARRLGFHEEEITGFHKDNEEYAEKPLKMLFEWKERNGSGATYEALYQALCHELCKRKRLAEEFCCI